MGHGQNLHQGVLLLLLLPGEGSVAALMRKWDWN